MRSLLLKPHPWVPKENRLAWFQTTVSISVTNIVTTEHAIAISHQDIGGT